MQYSREFIQEIHLAIDHFETLSLELVNLILTDTDQKDSVKIRTGEYHNIGNTALGNLSKDWSFEVRGEHCDFYNSGTKQTLTIIIQTYIKTNKKY